MKRVFAEWVIEMMPDDFSAFHISCGRGDDQYDGYFIHDKGATMLIKHGSDGLYHVRFEAPDEGLTSHADHWLSPSLVEDKYEPSDYGSFEVKK
jgi:hypothetical protein